MELSREELADYALKTGDLLVNRVNSRELVGKAAVIPNLPEPMVFESKNIRVRLLLPSHLPEFVSLFLQTAAAREAFQGDAKQTCGQASVNQPQVANLLMPLPPLPEQRRIVAKVEELLALCDELEARQTTVREHRTRLVHSALDQLTTAKNEQDFRNQCSFILHKSSFILEDVPPSVRPSSRLRFKVASPPIRGRQLRLKTPV